MPRYAERLKILGGCLLQLSMLLFVSLLSFSLMRVFVGILEGALGRPAARFSSGVDRLLKVVRPFY